MREHLEVARVARVRQAHGRHREVLLAGEVEGSPTGDEDLRLLRPLQEAGPRSGGAEHLLEVVEDQQHPAATDAIRDRLHGAVPQLLLQAEGLADRAGHELRIRDRRQRHEGDAVGKGVGSREGRLDREARLARAAGAGQGQQPRPVQQLADALDLRLAADEAGQLGGQDLEARRDGPDRRKVGRQARDDQLVQVLRAVEVLEPVLALVGQRDPVGQRSGHELAGRLRDEHLAAVRRRRDACGTMHVQPDVLVTGKAHLARCGGPSLRGA